MNGCTLLIIGLRKRGMPQGCVLYLLSHRKLKEWLSKGRGKRIVEWLGSGHGTSDALEREIEETEAFDRMLAEGKKNREKERKQNGKAKYIP